MSRPKPIARRLPAAAAGVRISTQLHHPTPDLQSLQGAYRGNISRLERSAEELSQASSDLGEEIRKMLEAEKEKDRSRNSSLRSSQYDEVNAKSSPPLREGSTQRSRPNSYSNSIVDVNNTARWGGYSPAGFVTSPVESVPSGSWGLHRVTSGSKSSRLSQMVEPTQEGRPLDSPLAPSSESLYSQEQQMSRRASQSSIARRYDQIAAQVEASSYSNPGPSPIPEDLTDFTGQHALDTRPSLDTLHDLQNAFKDFDGVHFSPDTEEYIAVDEKGNEVRRVSARTSSGSLLDAASLLRTSQVPRPISYAVPPPGQGMVYYPAPVPRVLNLPKRLSQMPASSVQVQRRSQMLDEMMVSSRKSAPWLSQSNLSDGVGGLSPDMESPPSTDQRRGMLNPRASVAHLANLPPQLRASVFFEHRPISQDVEIKSESAVATLDSILAASATAPVSVFTDHPYAGDVRKSVYAPEIRHAPKRSSTTLAVLTEAEKKPMKKRSSSIGRLFRKSSTDLDNESERPPSRGSTLMLGNEHGKPLSRPRSQLSLGDELEQTSYEIESPGLEVPQTLTSSGLVAHASNVPLAGDNTTTNARPSTAPELNTFSNTNDQIEDDFRNENGQENIDESDPIYAAPTTLLAELQVRKAQQKSRSRTAATAYPNGMHSTLLELDAVEEVNRKNRKKQRVNLAWEDPNLHAQEVEKDANDDDVPLGMLFPPTDGRKTHKLGDARDWHRPMGLMEKRALEDSEPLSRRRNRLHGLPVSRTSLPLPTVQLLVEEPHDDDEEAAAGEDVGETLGQRIRRLRTKDALDSTISEFAPKDGERPLSSFTDDVLSQFGTLEMKEQDVKGSKTSKNLPSQPAEEETLGQRRARLQREREASGDTAGNEQAGVRPALRSAQSLANLLSVNPAGSRMMSKEKEPAHGSLLHTSAQTQSKHKQELLSKNLRASGMMLEAQPLVNTPAGGARAAGTSGLLGAQTSAPAVGGFANGLYNNGNGGNVAAAAHVPAPPMFGVSGTNTYFASPTAGYSMGYNGMMSAHSAAPQPQQVYASQPTSPGLNPMAYAALNGGHLSTTTTMMMPGMTQASYGYPGYMNGGVVTYGTPGMAFPGIPTGLGGGMDMTGMPPTASMDQSQRAAIDRWRMSVRQL